MVFSPITGVCDMIGLQRMSVRNNHSSTLNSLPASLAKVPLQRHPTICRSIRVDAELSGDFKINGRYNQIVRKDTASDLLAILAMAEASDEFFRWCLDVDGDRAA